MEPNPDDNNIRIPTVLAAGPIVASLEGYNASTLPESLTRTIKQSRITIVLLEKKSTVKARYEVFRRLNKFGSPLSDQEIRNCTARLLGKEFPTQLRALADIEFIKAALSLSSEQQLRMGNEEMLLRLLAFNFSKADLKHKISEYLDDFMAYAAEGKFKLSPEVVARLERAFLLISKAFPNGDAFRFPNGFSTNLFDVVATGVFHNCDTLTQETLVEKHRRLMKSSELQAVIGAGSNTRKKLTTRITLGKTWFQP